MLTALIHCVLCTRSIDNIYIIMAKITKETFVRKGSDRTPKGTMPPDMLKRFNLKENTVSTNTEDSENYRGRGGAAYNRTVKRLMEMNVRHRVQFGICNEKRLPAPLRDAVKYFCVPMTGGGAGNYSNAGSLLGASNGEGNDPTKVPLKV